MLARWRVLLALSTMLVAAGARPARAADAGGSHRTIVFYDPDANYEVLPRIVAGINSQLASALPQYELKVVTDVAGMLQTVRATKAAYVLVAADYVNNVNELGAVPLMVTELNGSPYYKKVLVDRGAGTAGDLHNKRIAATTGDKSKGASQRVLSMLRQAELKVEGALVLGTSKDLDALLALTFGMADAALVTTQSLDTLRKVNPTTVASLRTVWTSRDLLRPVLVGLTSNETGGERAAVLPWFRGLGQTPQSRDVLQAMGIDKFAPYDNQLGKREATP